MASKKTSASQRTLQVTRAVLSRSLVTTWSLIFHTRLARRGHEWPGFFFLLVACGKLTVCELENLDDICQKMLIFHSYVNVYQRVIEV
jgi:hypothetical protein